MAFIKRCRTCSKLIFLSKTYEGSCCSCHDKILEKERQKKDIEKQKEQVRLQKEKARIRRLKADELLKKELELQKQKILEKQQKAKKEKAKSKKTDPVQDILQKKQDMISQKKDTEDVFTRDEMKNQRLLFIHAEIKRLKVVEWIDGKKRIALNKEREIRKTHSGGWSQEKFQKFVKAKKVKTSEWVIDLLERPGVMKLPYDKIRISADDELKKELEAYFSKKEE